MGTNGLSSRMTRQNIFILLLSTILSIAVCLTAAELVFRVVEPKSPPGTTYGKVIQKNTDGFRDREFTIPKLANTYRVLVLGDSFTWGVGLDLEASIPRLLEHELAKQITTVDVEVINAAIPGHNTVEQLLLLSDKGLKYEPDMVILVYNLNDIEYIPELSASDHDESNVVPVVEIDPGEEITQFSRNAGFRGFILEIERRSALARFLVPRVGDRLRRLGLIDSVEFSWVEKIFQGFTDDNPGWVESKNALREISRIAESEGFDFIVAVYPLLTQLDAYKGEHVHTTIQSYCHEIRIHCIDLLTVFANTDERDYWINYADSHPNAVAHRLVTDAILQDIVYYIPD